MSALSLLIMALAAWRLAYMLTTESGPWRVFERFRDRFPLGGLSTCIYCASVWCAALVYLVWLTPLQPLVYVLAVSAAGLMLAAYTGVMYRPPT